MGLLFVFCLVLFWVIPEWRFEVMMLWVGCTLVYSWFKYYMQEDALVARLKHDHRELAYSFGLIGDSPFSTQLAKKLWRPTRISLIQLFNNQTRSLFPFDVQHEMDNLRTTTTKIPLAFTGLLILAVLWVVLTWT